MSEFNEQTFLQILRSTPLFDNEYVQKELNVLADLLEEYGVESPSELKEKIQPPKKKSTPKSKKSKYALFVEDCALFITNRDAGQNVDAQIETLVQAFEKLSNNEIAQFAASYQLNLSSKKDKSRFKTWLETGQPPLSASEEKVLLKQQAKQQITQIYQDANHCFTEEQIQTILGIVKGIEIQCSRDELKDFVQTFESDLKASGKDKLIEKWEERLRGVKPTVQSKSKRTSKKAEPLDHKNNPYKDKIDGLISAFNDNPTDELKRDTIQKILEVVESVEKAYKFTELRNFVQNVFSSNVKGTSKTLLSNTEKYLKDNLCVPNIPTQENCQAPEESPILKEYVPVQADVTKEIENYVREAVQLRDEKSYELADDNILKIAELAEEVKKAYKIEGLKTFMKALGVNVVNVKNGELINKLVNHLEDVALMRFKAVQMREMK